MSNNDLKRLRDLKEFCGRILNKAEYEDLEKDILFSLNESNKLIYFETLIALFEKRADLEKYISDILIFFINKFKLFISIQDLNPLTAIRLDHCGVLQREVLDLITDDIKEYANEEYQTGSIIDIIRRDNLDDFKSYICSNKNFSLDEGICVCSLIYFDEFINIPDKFISVKSAAAFYGSEDIYEYIHSIHEESEELEPLYILVGNSVKLYEMNKEKIMRYENYVELMVYACSHKIISIQESDKNSMINTFSLINTYVYRFCDIYERYITNCHSFEELYENFSKYATLKKNFNQSKLLRLLLFGCDKLKRLYVSLVISEHWMFKDAVQKEYNVVQYKDIYVKEITKEIICELEPVFEFFNHVSFYQMFKKCSKLKSIEFPSKIDISKVTSLSGMFSECSCLEHIVFPTTFDTSNVYDMSEMFLECSSLINFEFPESFCTNKVKTVSAMFKGCSSIQHIIFFDNFDTSNTKNFSEMFFDCSSLQTIEFPCTFCTTRAKNVSNMFSYCPNLQLIRYLSNSTAKISNLIQTENRNHSTSFIEVIPRNTDLVIEREEEHIVSLIEKLRMNWIFRDQSEEGINRITINLRDRELTVISEDMLLELNELFSYFQDISFKEMFYNCSKLQEVTFPEIFDTRYVTNLSGMFKKCSKIQYIDFPESFVTSSVTDMSSMFSNCKSIEYININHFDTSNVTSMRKMFFSCTNLKMIQLPTTFCTPSLVDIGFMLSGCEKLEYFEIERFDLSQIKNMKAVFQNCSSLTRLNMPPLFSTRVTSLSCLFRNCTNLHTIDFPVDFNTCQVCDLSFMFDGCSSLKNILLPRCFSTSNVTTLRNMFSRCESLQSVPLTNFDTSKLVNMSGMFHCCTSLQFVIFPNVFATDNINDMSFVFNECTKLRKIKFLSHFATNHVPNVQCMFEKCDSLKTVEVPLNFNIENIKNMANELPEQTVIEDVSSRDSACKGCLLL